MDSSSKADGAQFGLCWILIGLAGFIWVSWSRAAFWFVNKFEWASWRAQPQETWSVKQADRKQREELHTSITSRQLHKVKPTSYEKKEKKKKEKKKKDNFIQGYRIIGLFDLRVLNFKTSQVRVSLKRLNNKYSIRICC